MQLITDSVVAELLDLRDCTDRLEEAFASLGSRQAATTLRVRATSGTAMASALAAAWPAGGVTGGKVYATHEGTFTFVVVVFDIEGRLLGVLEGDSLTRIRTAAGTGLAVRHLLKASPTVATLIGTGRQCPGHLAMLAQELPSLNEVRIVGRSPDAIAEALKVGRSMGLPIRMATDPAEAVSGADLVITLTSAREPLFPSECLAPGALVCALGATKADRCEIGPGVVARASTVVVDSLVGSKVECGDLLAAERAGVFRWEDALELGDIVAGRSKTLVDDGVTLFESQGVALQDLVAAAMVLEKVQAG